MADLSHLRGKAACIGAATHGCGEAPGWNSTELMGVAVIKAIEDAGLKLSDVDGIWAATAVHSMSAMSLAEHLGIHPKYSSGSNIGGSSFMAHALDAAMALDAGLVDVAVIAYGSNQRTAGGFQSVSEPMPYEAQYEPRNPITAYALASARYMHEFGATREHLAEVAVAARGWASHNPEAFTRDPLTVDDVLSARMISDPLGKLDCCLVTDGAAAMVMTRADRTKDSRQKPVFLLGAAMAHDHRMISTMPTLTTTCAADSGWRAFQMAGMQPGDMDTVQLYDPFTITPILFLEDLGYCEKGEGKDFVSGGRIAPGGELPVNTNGGGLSCVHPGMYGMFVMIEAIRQARGDAPGQQIPDAKLCLAHGNGGVLSSQVTTIWGTADTL
ncbi:MAG: acetyl-CoA acetyltransferase [Pseudomonadota bacterium]